MSLQVSNLYASRIFAENPSALWTLDDNFDFISLLGEEGKNILLWESDNIEEYPSETLEDIPLPDEDLKILGLTTASTLSGSVYFDSIDAELDLDQDKGTISINAFVYDFDGYIDNYEIGFIINGSPTYTTFKRDSIDEWQKIFYKAEIPESGIIYPYLKVNYLELLLEPESNSVFAINAISVGQWSELFQYESTGFLSASISNTEIRDLLQESTILDVLDITAFTADSYGISDPLNGYYLVEKNKMLSVNNKLPITFGATNITNIKAPVFGNIPSLVFPGLGFLNDSGRYKELTAEFWLRAFTKSSTPIKIFGPLASQDGVYVEKDYITLRVDSISKSYFVGKWYRPMLIDIKYSIENISLMVNGDTVIEFTIDKESLVLPTTDKDYVGFFGSELVYPFDVDAFAIYPYPVPEQVAKRRFVYGQGVDSFDNIVSNFRGDSFTVDFPFAKYTNTINYPDMTDWSAGFFVNSTTNSKFLSLPQFGLPQISFTESKNTKELLSDNYLIQDDLEMPFITLYPNEDYDGIGSRIYFQNINVLPNTVKSFFGIFKSQESLPESEQPIITISNNFNSNSFKITISNSGIKYYFNSTLLETKAVEPDQMFIAGIDISLFSQAYRSVLGNFFSNLQNLSLSLGGDFEKVFTGKIYKFTFSNKFFTDKDLQDYIMEDGIFYTLENLDTINKYIGNYTLVPQIISGNMALDIGSYGYWEDSLPLSYFGKNVVSRSGNSYYDLDLLQFNIETPSPIVFTRDRYEVLDGGLYNTLDFGLEIDGGSPSSTNFDLTFDGGVPSTTEFEQFLTDEQYDIAFREYAKPEYTVKTYMTIQHYTEVGNTPYSNYENIIKIGEDRVLDFDNVQNFANTKYEITDGTVIFPPKEQVDFNDYYVTTHIEIQSKGVIGNPIRIRKMSLSSLSYDESTFYSINSQNGFKMYPFTRVANSYIMKQKNPFMIYKDTSSYMYKSGDSGLSVMPFDSVSESRGITVPINQQVATEYLLGGIQFSFLYNKNYTFSEDMQIMKILTQDRVYNIFIEPEEGLLRARLVAYEEGSIEEASSIVFYQNGTIVDSPYIEPLSWNNITIALDESISLGGIVGQLEIYEGILINNIAFYKKSSDILGSTFAPKTWQELRTQSEWGDWLETNPRTSETYVWSEVGQKLITTTFVIDGKSIYETSYGLSRAVASDESSVTFSSDGIKVFSDTVWQQFADKAV